MRTIQSQHAQVAGGTILAVATAGLIVAGVAAQRPPDPQVVAEGQMLFEHEWQPGDPLSAGGDGLGPVFNARSCVECHSQGGTGGSGTAKHNVLAFEVHPTAGTPQVQNGVVHHFAIAEALQDDRQSVADCFPIVKGGLQVRSGCTTTFQDFDPVRYFELNSPPLFGVALIERISDGAIRRNAALRGITLVGKEFQLDFQGTPIGRPHVLADGRIGKFGWKGQFATVDEFVAAACAVEMGLTNPIRAQAVPKKYRDDAAARPDMTEDQLYALTSFVAALPRPVEVLPRDSRLRAQAEHGKMLFSSIGCADCHTPDLGGVAGVYSDLLLHRIEDPEADPSYFEVEALTPLPAHHPTAAEWKTPPLWGVADSAPYLHDGSAATLKEAIERHSGEARRVTQAYLSLQDGDRQALLTFLKTLRAPGTAATSVAARSIRR